MNEHVFKDERLPERIPMKTGHLQDQGSRMGKSICSVGIQIIYADLSSTGLQGAAHRPQGKFIKIYQGEIVVCEDVRRHCDGRQESTIPLTTLWRALRSLQTYLTTHCPPVGIMSLLSLAFVHIGHHDCLAHVHHCRLRRGYRPRRRHRPRYAWYSKRFRLFWHVW